MSYYTFKRLEPVRFSDTDLEAPISVCAACDLWNKGCRCKWRGLRSVGLKFQQGFPCSTAFKSLFLSFGCPGTI